MAASTWVPQCSPRYQARLNQPTPSNVPVTPTMFLGAAGNWAHGFCSKGRIGWLRSIRRMALLSAEPRVGEVAQAVVPAQVIEVLRAVEHEAIQSSRRRAGPDGL